MGSMWVFRLLLIALSALLAGYLILSGHVVIGVIIAAMAALRAVLLARMQHRRQQLRRRVATYRNQHSNTW